MISDHGSANAKLTTIAKAQKLTIPNELDAKHKTDIETLRNGKELVDETYVHMQRDAHAEAVELYENYINDGDNAELKAFAKRTLPTLKMHRETIEKIAGATNRKERSSRK
jgi:putative membrane protein